jgi:hypothetical protein
MCVDSGDDNALCDAVAIDASAPDAAMRRDLLARSRILNIACVHLFGRSCMKHWLLTCGLMVAISAFAEPGTPKGPKALAALDTDGDKMISLAEAQQGSPGLAARFNELDTNKDGLLSIEEVIEGRPMRGVRFTRSIQDDFAAADGNADGKLSRSEAEAMPIMSDFFDEIDANADGYITTAEIDQHAKTRGPIFVVKEAGVEAGAQR